MLRSDEPSVIVIVVDDSGDDELTAAIAREDRVPSVNFEGVWGAEQDDGEQFVSFELRQLSGDLVRQWVTDHVDRQLLNAIVDVPHYVSLMPAEIAQDADTLEALVPRMGGSLMVGVEHRSPQVGRLLAQRAAD